MGIDRALITLHIFLLSSICYAAGSRQEVIWTLLDSEKFEEARKYTEENKILDYWGPKTITGTEKCVPILKECESAVDNLQQIRNCLARIEKNCDDRYLTSKWADRNQTLINKLHSLKDSTGKNSKVASACEDGMKWGYIRVKKADCLNCAWSLKQDPKKLFGTFQSHDECEEKRLLDADWATEECTRRYLGAAKTIDIFEAQAMALESGQTTSLHLKFKSIETCKTSVDQGFRYVNDEGKAFDIQKLGSKAPVRFISECKKRTLKLCQKYDQAFRDTSDLL